MPSWHGKMNMFIRIFKQSDKSVLHITQRSTMHVPLESCCVRGVWISPWLLVMKDSLPWTCRKDWTSMCSHAQTKGAGWYSQWCDVLTESLQSKSSTKSWRYNFSVFCHRGSFGYSSHVKASIELFTPKTPPRDERIQVPYPNVCSRSLASKSIESKKGSSRWLWHQQTRLTDCHDEYFLHLIKALTSTVSLLETDIADEWSLQLVFTFDPVERCLVGLLCRFPARKGRGLSNLPASTSTDQRHLIQYGQDYSQQASFIGRHRGIQ